MASPRATVSAAPLTPQKRTIQRPYLQALAIGRDVRSDHATNRRRLFTDEARALRYGKTRRCDNRAGLGVALEAASPEAPQIMSRKRYVGAIAYLRDQTALVEWRVGIPGQVMARFEAPHLQEAQGWWEFPETDFEPTAGLEVVGGQYR